MIDALGLAEDLEQARFPRNQAHGLARTLRDRTAEDLAARHDVRELELRLESRLSRIAQRIADVQTAMIKWFTGVMIAQAAAIVALIKLLSKGASDYPVQSSSDDGTIGVGPGVDAGEGETLGGVD